ncbi:MAG: hypothetical protein P4M05_31120 [Bradyrhizobium sp.]|nr:hypothetical protein [Bradyrhizobium sp.]
MSEVEIIQDEMRLFALETVVCQLWAMTFAQLPSGAFEKTRSAWLEGARQKTFAGADAATSDLFSAELEGALERLSGMMDLTFKGLGNNQLPSPL